MKIGDRYIVTEGCYSDYGILAVLVAQCEFDWDATVAEIVSGFDDAEHRSWHRRSDLVNEMVKRGLVKEDDATSVIHIGDYGDVEMHAERDMLMRRADALANAEASK